MYNFLTLLAITYYLVLSYKLQLKSSTGCDKIKSGVKANVRRLPRHG